MVLPRTGLLGAGTWGRNHLRVLLDLDLELKVWDPDPLALARVPEACRAASEDDLMHSCGLEALVVATPARTHFGLARRALKAGLDVLVEKPLTLVEREGEELAALAEQAGRILMVGHIPLYHGAIQELARMLAQGRLGEVRYLTANRLNLGVVREEEDILWSFAPHDVAVMLELCKLWPLRVSALGGSYLRKGRADVTVTHLEFPKGVRAHIFVSWLHPFKEHRLVVIGEAAMAVFRDGPGGGDLRLYDQPLRGIDQRPAPAAQAGEPISFSKVEPLRSELEHFLECVRARSRPLTGARHGLAVLRVLQTARVSLLEGGLPMTCQPVEAP